MLKTEARNIGLDVGSSSIKLFELTAEGGTLKLANFKIVPVERKDDEARREIIKSTIQSLGGPPGPIRTSVSGPSVLIRYIWLPLMSKGELSGAIKFESEKYIPFSHEEVILDSQIIEEVKETKKMRVVLVAVKKDFIDAEMKLFGDCGLELELIDIDSFCLANAFLATNSKIEGKVSFALIDIGARYTNVHIMQGRRSYFSRDIPIAGDSLSTALSERIGVELKAAEDLKRSPGEKLGEVKSAIASVVEELAGEIRLCFDYYENQFERGIEIIYLTGGSSQFELLRQLLEAALGTKMIYWRPVANLGRAEGLDAEALEANAAQLTTAFGLALRD